MVERAGVAQAVGDGLVGVEDVFGLEPVGGGGVVGTVFGDGAVDGEFFAEAGEVVVLAVAGSGVDEAGAVFEGDVVGGDDGGGGGAGSGVRGVFAGRLGRGGSMRGWR